jgi:hypothetical protein
MARLVLSSLLRLQIRSLSSLNRPSPPPLSRSDQREFEELYRSANANKRSSAESEAELAMHSDARPPLTPEFSGDTNPKTGETGGPKQEPVRQWGDSEGDWSFKGRVTDF